ncbi:hypothetical protein [Flexivirga oryzae]|uniref:Exo-alpha-sialidase n=1 Tax=Flexivirga oryzae TaxID=1794944 RepID=A0A839N4M1_9MICO|nr:hypothetical protein [Flexivirga oryzae]MBB2892257.1 hypothetical protein [Flexivirga oryzae]
MNADRDDFTVEDDPVAGFFADARAEVADEPTTELDWQRIVHESRRHARRRSRLTLLSSAAVAVIAIVAVLVWQQQGVSGGVQQGQAIAGSSAVVHSAGTSSNASSVSKAQTPTAVPKSFQTWSLSNAGSNTLYALGSQDCGSGICPVLLRSGTNGAGWNAVHKFTGTDTSAATGNDIAQIQPERAITQTRFAKPQVGFVFGGDLWVTRDSGATFTELSHPGTRVLDLEINRNEAVLLSADNCAQGECNGPLYVTRFDPSSNTVGDSGAQLTLDTPISAGRVLVQNGQAFVQLTAAKTGMPLAPMRLNGTTLQQLTAPSACYNTQLQAITAATTTDKLQLFAVCNPKQLSGDRLGYTLLRSDDAGQTWTSVSTGSLILPRRGDVWLAVADADHIAASSGGPRDTNGVPAGSSAGSLVVSTNGGTVFGPVTAPPGATLPAMGFDWTASPGVYYLYAIPHTTHGFWMTSDFGGKWTVIDPRS